jgi:hypothetical protein
MTMNLRSTYAQNSRYVVCLHSYPQCTLTQSFHHRELSSTQVPVIKGMPIAQITCLCPAQEIYKSLSMLRGRVNMKVRIQIDGSGITNTNELFEAR